MTTWLFLLMLAPGQTPAVEGLPAEKPAAVATENGGADSKGNAAAADAQGKAAEGGGAGGANTGGQAASSEGAKEGDKGAEESKAAPAAGGLWSTLDDMAHSGALGYMLEGGFFMWPIFFLGVVAFGVMIERYRSLKMLTTDTSALRGEVLELLQADKVEEALRRCDAEQGPVPAILSAGLRKFLVLRRLDYDPGKIEEQVVKGMDDYSVHIVAALERHLPILATVSSVAPMLGFLGTVQGMVVSFDDIVAQMGKTNIVESAAAGIKVSLLTTVLGLIVGIPAFMAFNYFTSVINRFVLEVEESASELIEAVTLQMALRRRESK